MYYTGWFFSMKETFHSLMYACMSSPTGEPEVSSNSLLPPSKGISFRVTPSRHHHLLGRKFFSTGCIAHLWNIRVPVWVLTLTYCLHLWSVFIFSFLMFLKTSWFFIKDWILYLMGYSGFISPPPHPNKELLLNQ